MTTEPVEYKLVEVSSEASRSPHRSPRRPRQVPRTPPRSANQGAPANMNVLPKGTKVYLSEGTVAYVVRQCSTGEYEIHVPSVSSNFRATRDEFSLKWPVPVQDAEAYEPKSPTRSSQATMQAATPAQQSFDDPWRSKPPQEPQRNFYGMQHPDPIHNGNGHANGNGRMASQGNGRGGYQSENRAQQPSRSVWAHSPDAQVSRSRLNPNSPEWKTSTRSEPPRQAQARPEPRSMATQNIASQLSQQQNNSRDFNNRHNQRSAPRFDGKNDWLSVSSRSPRSPPSRRQAPKRPKGSAPPGLGPRQPTRSNPSTASSGQRRTAPPAQQETRAPRTPQRARPSYNKSQANNRVNLPTGPGPKNDHDQKKIEITAPSASKGRKQPVEYFKNTCRHFLSDEGCRRGSKCRFYHPGEQTKVNKDEFCTIAANGARDEADNFSRPRGRKSGGKAQRQRYEACDL